MRTQSTRTRKIRKFLYKGGSQDALFEAIDNENVSKIRRLIDRNAVVDINETNDNGETPLYYAVYYKSLRIVKILIELGADVNKTNFNGETPLYLASEDGKLDIAKELIGAGADVNESNFKGETPLYIASEDGYLDIVKALIAAGADVNETNNRGETPLYIASDNGYFDIVKALIAARADVNESNNDGNTPLYIASENGYLDIVKALIAAGADVNESNFEGETPLYVANLQGYIDIERVLREAGANANSNSNSNSNNNNNNSNNNGINNTANTPNNTPLFQRNMPEFVSGVVNTKCFDPIMANENNITSEKATFYIVRDVTENDVVKQKVASISCLDSESLEVYKKSTDYKMHQCTLDTTVLPMTSLHVERRHLIGKPLRRLELGQKVYVLDSEFQKVKLGKAYVLEPAANTIGRIASDNFIRGGSAMSADHCQTVFADPIYSIKEISVPTGGKRRVTCVNRKKMQRTRLSKISKRCQTRRRN